MLLVDDHDDFRVLMHHYLSTAKVCDLETAPDGETALSMVASCAYDLILIDLQMPLMDGYELARKLRRAGYARPIIAITAHAMVQHRSQALEAGCDALYTKPVDLPVFREAILGYL